jgi:hypothetical protein
MVNVNDPVGESLGIVRVRVVVKSGEEDGTSKSPLTPAGNPSTVNETCELNPFNPATCTTYFAFSPWGTLWDGGSTPTWKSGEASMIKATGSVWVFPPPIPVKVIAYLPGEADWDAEIVRVEVKVGLPDGVLNATVTPLGTSGTVKATVCVAPDTRFTVTVHVVDPPVFTIWSSGETPIEKSKPCWGPCTVRTALAWRVTPIAEPVSVIVYVPVGVDGEVEMLKAGGVEIIW